MSTCEVNKIIIEFFLVFILFLQNFGVFSDFCFYSMFLQL